MKLTGARGTPRALNSNLMSLTLQSVLNRFKTRFLDIKIQAIKEMTLIFVFNRKVGLGLFLIVAKPNWYMDSRDESRLILDSFKN